MLLRLFYRTDMILQKELIQTFFYDPTTGFFSKKLKNGMTRRKIGRKLSCGSRIIKINDPTHPTGKIYYATSLAFLYMTGELIPQRRIEFINDDKSDNRWENLRVKLQKSDLTQEIVKNYLNYDPITGLFKWIRRHNSRLPGMLAGSLSKHNKKNGEFAPDQGYYYIQLLGRRYGAHRVAFLYMTGSWPTYEVDHINHNRGDNRWENLRDVTHTENVNNKREKGICVKADLRRTNKMNQKQIDDYQIESLNTLIATLRAENSSLRDDIVELEREMAYVSRTKYAKRKHREDE